MIEAGFYSDLVECLPEVPATQGRFPAGTGWDIFALRPLDQLIQLSFSHDFFLKRLLFFKKAPTLFFFFNKSEGDVVIAIEQNPTKFDV